MGNGDTFTATLPRLGRQEAKVAVFRPSVVRKQCSLAPLVFEIGSPKSEWEQ